MLFVLEISTMKISKHLGISHLFAPKVTRHFRNTIPVNAKRGELFSVEVKADEANYGCKRKGKRERVKYRKISAFGFLKRQGVVSAEVFFDVYAKTLSGLITKKVEKTTNRRALISDVLLICLFVGNSLQTPSFDKV